MSVFKVPQYEFPAIAGEERNPINNETTRLIRLQLLGPSPTNPRTDFDREKLIQLASTIKEHGVLEPLLVRALKGNKSPRGAEYGYEIIAGERRWRAAQIAGLTEVPCIVKDFSDQQVLEVQFIENLQRDDLKPIEEARGFKRLIDSKEYTAEKLAQKLGKSRGYVFDRVALLNTMGSVKEALEEGTLAPRVALQLHRSELSPEIQEQAVETIVKNKMTTREAEQHIEMIGKPGYLANTPEAIESRNIPVDDALEGFVERGQKAQRAVDVVINQTQSVQVAPSKPKNIDPFDYHALLESDPKVGSADYYHRMRVEEEINQERSRREQLAVQSYVDTWLKNTSHFPSAQGRLVKACMINTEKIREDVIVELEATARKRLEEQNREVKALAEKAATVKAKRPRVTRALKKKEPAWKRALSEKARAVDAFRSQQDKRRRAR